MSYSTTNDIRDSHTLTMRIVACAATEGVEEPLGWVSQRMWKFATLSEWTAAWQYAKDNQTSDHNPDIGSRESVINDAMILAAVQALLVA